MAVQDCDQFIVLDVPEALFDVSFAKESEVRHQLAEAHLRRQCPYFSQHRQRLALRVAHGSKSPILGSPANAWEVCQACRQCTGGSEPREPCAPRRSLRRRGWRAEPEAQPPRPPAESSGRTGNRGAAAVDGGGWFGGPSDSRTMAS